MNLSAKLGFTIIELVVSISIIIIITSLSYAGYSTLNHRQKLISAGQTLKNQFRDVQSRAFNGEVDCSVCNCDVTGGQILEGWFVDFSNREYYGKCTGIEFSTTSLDVPSDIFITPLTLVTKFTADPPGMENIDEPDQDVIICLSHNSLPGWYYKIYIFRSGEISDSTSLESSCL